MYQDESTISFHWRKQIISMSGIPRYSTARQRQIYNGSADRLDIEGVSFSTTSPDVVYVLTRHNDDYDCDTSAHTDEVAYGPECEIFTIDTYDSSVTSMAVEGLELDDVLNVTCHGKFVCVTTPDAIYKCVAKSRYTLSAVQAFPYDYILTPEVVAGNRYLYLHSCRMLCIVDSDTMTRLSTVSLQHIILDMAVLRDDDKLHVATRDGVHIYTGDGTYTGQSYLDGRHCNSITFVADRCVAVASNTFISLVSHDLTVISTYEINVDFTPFIRCNQADGTLAIVNNHNCCELVLLPQEVYRPPFSLFSLCMSTILLNADELPISLLPPKLFRLVKSCI